MPFEVGLPAICSTNYCLSGEDQILKNEYYGKHHD